MTGSPELGSPEISFSDIFGDVTSRLPGLSDPLNLGREQFGTILTIAARIPVPVSRCNLGAQLNVEQERNSSRAATCCQSGLGPFRQTLSHSKRHCDLSSFEIQEKKN